MLNRITLIGECISEPKRLTTIDGEITKFELRTWDSGSSPRFEFHTVLTKGDLAIAVHEQLKPKDGVCVEGSIKSRTWERYGQKTKITEVYATFLKKVGTVPIPGQRKKREPKPNEKPVERLQVPPGGVQERIPIR